MRLRGDRSSTRGDGGYVLLLTALLIVPLMTFTAFAVDVGAWYAQKAKMQRAADSAALAGVFWALDPANKWLSTARNTASANGFSDSATTSVTIERLGGTRVRVRITQYGLQFFSTLFLSRPVLKATATADYERPLHMGSPENRLGSDPDLGYQPYFWLNTGSDTTVKGNGDRFTSGTCASGSWGCSSGVNDEHAASGYTFHIAAAPSTSLEALTIEVYDPAYTYTGDLCNGVFLAAADLETVQAMATSRYGEPTATSAGRYGRTPYCPGDQSLGNGTAPNTTYIVRAPDLTPLTDLDNPPICAITFDGRKPTGGTALRTLLAGTGSAMPIGREDARFSDHYHRWFTICSIPPTTVNQLSTPENGGEFVVQVKTTAGLGSPPPPTTTANLGLSLGSLDSDTSPAKGGYNRYALRAGRGTAGVASWGAGITLYAPSRLPIYVNGVDVANGTAAGSIPSVTFSTSFFAVRITPEYAGNVLQLSLWDIGDLSGTPGKVDFTLTSPDAGVVSTMLQNQDCVFRRDGVDLTSVNPYAVTVEGCQITGLKAGTGDPSSTGFNGRLVVVSIPVPSDYSCDVADGAAGCWVKVSAIYRGVPNDTTTWSATMLGGPVHLVE